ncbi:MAG: carboxypeptidase regulatory-like domain-containing protein [Sedimentisphaerales bacterium]|nr:carboxypeptidase regulatory-like domain-containing protein [Sedimentisphaerales bacterium]
MNASQMLLKVVVVAGILLLTNSSDAARLPVTGEAVQAETCTLAGTVVDADTGQPVPFFHLRQMNRNGTVVEHLETDEQGRFRTTAPKGSDRYFALDRSRQGTYIIDWLAQEQAGLRPFSGVVNEDQTDLLIKVKLWPVTTLTGRVVDGSGRPVVNASVYIHCDVPAVKTDANGTFHVEVAPTKQDFDLFAITADRDQAGLAHLKGGSTTTTIELEPTASYRGRVRDTENRPVGPFRFLVGLRLNGSNNDCLQQNVLAEADGTFVVDSLCPEAKYLLWWFPDEQVNRTLGTHGEKWVDLSRQGLDDPIELAVTQYLNTITARVVDANGAPIENARVVIVTRRLQSQGLDRLGSGVRTDGDGGVSLHGLTDGLAAVHVYKSGLRSRYIWAPTDAKDVEIVLRPFSEPGLCEVQVVDDDYEPVPDVPVRLDFTSVESGELLSSQTARTDADGRVQFAIEIYADGLRAMGAVSCDVEGYDLAYNSIPNYTDAEVKLVLHKPGQHWSGRLVDPQQNPIPAAELHLTSMSQHVTTPQRTTPQALDQSIYRAPSPLPLAGRSDQEGRFVLSRFNRKDFVRVMVKAAGFSSDELDFSPEQEGGEILRASGGIVRTHDYVFQLSPDVATLSGVVMDASPGEPVADAHLSLKRINGSARDVTTDGKGAFRIEDLEPGEYAPCLENPTDGSDTSQVCVPEIIAAKAGETIQATIQVREGVVLKGRLVDAATQRPPTGERTYLDARLESGHTVASSRIAADGSWELLLAPGDYRLYYVQFVGQVGRFMASQRPLSVAVEDKAYDEMVLEVGDEQSLSLQPASLVGKVLPPLAGLTTSALEFDAAGRMILVCFFDVQQRPSRNAVLDLTGRAERFGGQGVVVVAVQAAPIEQQELGRWVEENGIAFAVARTTEQWAPLAWGVRSLPWLILTDRNHVVQAEGSSLDELDAKIMDMYRRVTRIRKSPWAPDVLSFRSLRSGQALRRSRRIWPPQERAVSLAAQILHYTTFRSG